MKENHPLKQAYSRSAYPLVGHGKRNVQVLKDALAGVDGDLDSDMYGSGKVIEDFEARMAELLGKPAAVFFPSGTMAQQIALRIWCDERGMRRVAYHPLCHLELHEEDGLKELHGIAPVLLADRERTIGLADVEQMPEEVACLLLELPQREIGGQLPDYDELVAISAYCREKGIKLHLDGARLLEILPYYGKTAAEVCDLFDSVYMSFYKGVGGIAGAILAGDEAFAARSKVWKRRHGGDLISLYPYILSADYYYSRTAHKMAQYYEEAKELAALYNACSGVATKPSVPVSNMFHVHVRLPKEQLESILLSICENTGIGMSSYVAAAGEDASCFEVSIGDRYAGVPKDALRQAFRSLAVQIQSLAARA
ncbi:threonine aldolase family protein [Cohnella nanjingensis]|uniref:DegT/DnrJ/EryC1/StrS family aminotransferase n=1 Tax=Cohnella nanjingensis TaxID=1387779 RepID=A0A7X0RLL8_9BACL|nr:beta-eliminating lyase-related protein [Cohnella nanjingensis]MBB6669553.1 DegT/DnrJ/EryC1/StrS family aminotransferase [Cohnella nanjingensis]